jgi:hypothetical protein
MLLLIVGIGLWCQMFLEPRHLLPEELRCFQLLGRILYILRSGPKAVRKAQLLQRLVNEHHALFVKLYPLEAKPKVHYLLHIPGCIARFSVNLSCFVTERRHKIGKGIAARSFKEFQDTILRQSLLQTLRKFKQPDACRPSTLAGKPTHVPEDQLAMLGMGHLSPLQTAGVYRRSTQASLVSVGGIYKDDVFLFREGPRVLAAEALEFFGYIAGDVIVRCRVLRHEGGIVYSRAPAAVREAFVRSGQVFALVPYLHWQPDTIYIVAGADSMD